MSSKIRLGGLNLWANHEARVLKLLGQALELLASEGLDGTEPELNRRLYDCLERANHNIYEETGEELDILPIPEARSQPSPETFGGKSERKIPDFQYRVRDRLAKNPLLAIKSFVIECKRLGTPTASGWEFNLRYVDDGVARFIDLEWRYGNGVASGAMVGYVQDMTIDEVRTDVEDRLLEVGIDPLTHTSAGPPVHSHTHTLVREFEQSPFELKHLWVQRID